MERELEFKLLGLDFNYYEELLKEKGATLIAHEFQTNTVIDSTNFPLIDEDCYLRIRETKNLLNNLSKNELTFKKKIRNQYARENLEYTIEFDNKENLIEILKNLKLDKYIVGTKERTSYKYKNLRIDFDIWDKDTYPYPYIEIEANTNEELYELLNELNIDKKHISLKSITQLQEELRR
ncbi:class IV adenylate cyclase [Miniphocaeibacter halophilus]|uniref:Class IV adenylate cyclase n=1 Tax=Miniphocaeibacter halophilus TaxID=2931922 RepID=A0AC61MQ55_9FIRM|nr:class IV adenylate cyclase [Miniphocaeibacter halophilus]QQK07705.1 class IV adenylate cyclase [Miniphocaeibacter halophilus]